MIILYQGALGNAIFLMNDDVLFLHGAYHVSYDILPGIPDSEMKAAFDNHIDGRNKITSVLFGHYHYQIDRKIDDIEYHCIRPVGHHRDRDVRAGYSMMENGVLTHHRVPYDLEEVIYDTKKTIACRNHLKLNGLNCYRMHSVKNY